MLKQPRKNMKENYLATCLYDCIEDGNVGAVELLLKNNGANPNVVLPDKGIAPFHFIVGYSGLKIAEEITKLFLRHGGDPNVRSEDNMTPVHVAAAWGRTSILDLLLKSGADINVRDDDDKTPLDYAESEKHLQTLLLLQEYNRSLSTETDNYHNITLEKVNTQGHVIPKYETVKTNKYCINNTNNFSKDLPRKEIHSCVKNWCIEHAAVDCERNELKGSEININNKIFTANKNSDNECEFNENEDKISYFNVDFVSKRKRKNYFNISTYFDENLETDNQKNVSKNIEDARIDENISQLNEFKLNDNKGNSEVSESYNILDKSNIYLSDNSVFFKNDENSLILTESKLDNNPKNVLHPEVSQSYGNSSGQSGTDSSDDLVYVKNASRESGVDTLASDLSSLQNSLHSFSENMFIGPVNSSNVKYSENDEYITCDEGTVKTHERNIIDSDLMTSDTRDIHSSLLTSDMSSVKNKVSQIVEKTYLIHDADVPCQVSECIDAANETILSIAEEYKYTDQKEGIVLIEKRYFVTPQINIEENESASSKTNTVASSPCISVDYDTETLRNELTSRGERPGPITSTTKRVYLRRLMQLRRTPLEELPPRECCNRVYSVELEKTLRNPDWANDLAVYKELESAMVRQFNQPNPLKKWREGVAKESFTYLLMDPRVTQNLPSRSEKLKMEETWNIFLSSVFYVGKGKRSRPYSHLYDAVKNWNSGMLNVPNKKLKHILNIWNEEKGVVCLHIFQNVIPVEAYTREAAMISAMKLENLKNVKVGDFYGITATWSQRQKKQLGVYLLYKAMCIFLHEGERQLRPNDI